MNKLIDILNWSEEYLKKYSFSKPRLEAEKVLAHVLGYERIALYAYFDRPLENEEKDEVKRYLKEMTSKNLGFEKVLKNSTDKNISGSDIENHQNSNMELLEKSCEYLEKHGIANSRIETEYIFAHVLGCKRMMLKLNFSKKLSDDEKESIRKLLLDRVKKRKPLQYLLGYEEFFGYRFNVNESVLIPRPETELLVEQCINLLYGVKNPKILDIGVGSGAIAITLAKEMDESAVLGVDISDAALEVANGNMELNNAKNVKFIKSDVFSNVNYHEFDLIVSNPPYIPEHEYVGLMPEVRLHEPKLALTAEKEGYYFYEKISKEAPTYLKTGGYLAFEVGYNQAGKVRDIMEENGFENVVIVRDYEKIERMVIGRKK